MCVAGSVVVENVLGCVCGDGRMKDNVVVECARVCVCGDGRMEDSVPMVVEGTSVCFHIQPLAGN